jgi:hypothetical protein
MPKPSEVEGSYIFDDEEPSSESPVCKKHRVLNIRQLVVAKGPPQKKPQQLRREHWALTLSMQEAIDKDIDKAFFCARMRPRCRR